MRCSSRTARNGKTCPKAALCLTTDFVLSCLLFITLSVVGILGAAAAVTVAAGVEEVEAAALSLPLALALAPPLPLPPPLPPPPPPVLADMLLSFEF